MHRDLGHRRQRGFTLVELVVVIVIAGVLAVVVLPSFKAASGAAADAYRDSVMAGLRLAQSTALSHRRLVCVQFAAGRMQVTIAPANPAAACTSVLVGPDGASAWAAPPSGVTMATSPSATLYFNADGSVSGTAGGSATSFTLTPTGLSAITVRGLNGVVE